MAVIQNNALVVDVDKSVSGLVQSRNADILG